MKTGLKLDGIVRVSRTGDREYLRSPDQQEADLRRWADDNGHELVHIHVAVDQSARKGAHPAIEEAKARALDGVTDGVVVPYVSRYTRNTLYGLQTLQELLDAGKHVFSRDVPFDLRTPEGAKYFRDKLSEAEWESDVRAGAFARGVKEAINRGHHLSAPFGYRKANGKGSGLAVKPEEAKIVKLMFELRADGWSWPRIAAHLNDLGELPRPHKRDGIERQSRWSHKTARQVVNNRAYIGTAYNGPHEVTGAHEAIVDESLYRLANRVKGTKPRGPDGGYLLSGLVRCSGCGYAMTSNAARDARYYRCRSAQQHGHSCPAPAMANAEELEQLVTETFEEDFLSGKYVPVTDESEVIAAVEAVEQATRAYRDSRQLWVTRTEDDDEAELQELMVETRATMAECKHDLIAAQNRARGVDLPDRFGPDAWKRASVTERRHYLSLVYRAIIVRRSKRWREPVADRAETLPVIGTPDDISLIDYVAALPDPTATGVEAA